MEEKKISNDEIIDAICLKFSSVENYAEHLGTSRQNIYNKVSRKSKKFFIQLIKDGIFDKGFLGSEKPARSEDDIEELKMTNKILLEKISRLEAENKELRDRTSKDIVVDAREHVGKKK